MDMKTLYRGCHNRVDMPSSVALISDMPAWVSLMGLEWLYHILQKVGFLHKAK